VRFVKWQVGSSVGTPVRARSTVFLAGAPLASVVSVLAIDAFFEDCEVPVAVGYSVADAGFSLCCFLSVIKTTACLCGFPLTAGHNSPNILYLHVCSSSPVSNNRSLHSSGKQDTVTQLYPKLVVFYHFKVNLWCTAEGSQSFTPQDVGAFECHAFGRSAVVGRT